MKIHKTLLVTNASAGNPSSILLLEDASSGSNKMSLTGPSAIAADVSIQLPNSLQTGVLVDSRHFSWGENSVTVPNGILFAFRAGSHGVSSSSKGLGNAAGFILVNGSAMMGPNEGEHNFGIADGGGDDTIDLQSAIDNDLGSCDIVPSATDEDYNGYYIYIYAGAAKGERRRITDYTAENNRCTVDSVWQVVNGNQDNPDNTSKYVIIANQYALVTKNNAEADKMTAVFAKAQDDDSEIVQTNDKVQFIAPRG